MATVREELQAKITALEAEAAELKTHLANGGTWLEQEMSVVESWFSNLLTRLRPQAPTPPVPPA